jgi:hypothetical protein
VNKWVHRKDVRSEVTASQSGILRKAQHAPGDVISHRPVLASNGPAVKKLARSFCTAAGLGACEVNALASTTTVPDTGDVTTAPTERNTSHMAMTSFKQGTLVNVTGEAQVRHPASNASTAFLAPPTGAVPVNVAPPDTARYEARVTGDSPPKLSAIGTEDALAFEPLASLEAWVASRWWNPRRRAGRAGGGPRGVGGGGGGGGQNGKSLPHTTRACAVPRENARHGVDTGRHGRVTNGRAPAVCVGDARRHLSSSIVGSGETVDPSYRSRDTGHRFADPSCFHLTGGLDRRPLLLVFAWNRALESQTLSIFFPPHKKNVCETVRNVT